VSVESIIRTAILVYLSASTPVAIPNTAGLIGLFGAIRQKGVPAKGQKGDRGRFQGAARGVSRLHPRSAEEGRERGPAENPRRFVADEPAHPGARAPVFPARFRSRRCERCSTLRSPRIWQKITGGKTDDSSLLTIFVCLAAGLPPGRRSARPLPGR
jgi:hypothetical protein